MRAVIQRVQFAEVAVDGETVGAVKEGLMILLGVVEGDTDEQAQVLAVKTAKLRIFEDEDGKMNRSVCDIGGECLVVSQFTLCADCKKGNRPSFTSSAAPDEAKRLYELYSALLKENGIKKVENGVFGADMKVTLLNDGPVTILLDTDIWKKA
ncbi:MAG TPA: D-tyrosyl-tRNA(Tyr) deacylase [Ruminococcaceae bacterium]|nr:D-tyrosyl-tRNA(Tyr) deacylase [Oscillospiraceae bacterium]